MPARAAADAPAAPYKLERGPFDVETIELTLHDKDRVKELPILVRAPKPHAIAKNSQEKHPLIIFSHGMGGSSDAFATLSEHWAGHGYVVIHPTHEDSVRLRRAKGEKITRESFLAAGVRQVDPVGRVKDIVLILDRLGEIESRVPALRDRAGKGLIDREHICMAGHSAGAFTTQMIAGVRMGGRLVGARSFADARIKAFMPISPQGVGRAGMNKESWSSVALPMLAVTGSEDVTPVSDETPESRRHCFEFSKALGNKHLLWIEGAKHSSFGGNAFDPPNLRKATDMAMKCVTTAFLDANLRDDATARAWLARPDPAKALTNGVATLQGK
jgi:predicted dienelactone hydrolase